MKFQLKSKGSSGAELTTMQRGGFQGAIATIKKNKQKRTTPHHNKTTRPQMLSSTSMFFMLISASHFL